MKKRIPIAKIIWLTVLALFVGFFTKVWLWENSYYAEKEGSERATAINNTTSDIPEVDTTEPTEQEVAEYTVEPDHPRYLSIPSIGLNKARILPMGLTQEGALDTPNNAFDAGWYTNSSKPGQGGTLVLDGHTGAGVVAIFNHLPDIPIGGSVFIERGDGVIFEYEVAENKSVLLSESDAYMSTTAMISPDPEKESVTIITCTGEWDEDAQTYKSRQFLRAVLVGNNEVE